MKIIRVLAWRGVVAAGLSAWLSSGCASYRISTNLEPSSAPIPAPVNARFTIAKAHYSCPTNLTVTGFGAFSDLNVTDEYLRSNLMATAVATYPKTFSEGADAIPLSVEVTYAGGDTQMNEALACVSCVTLTIVPLHTIDNKDLMVSVSSGDAAIDLALSRPVTFTRSDDGWLSMLPTGWIPVPSSKGERAWGTDSANQEIGRASLRGCVEAIAVRLRQIQPEEWANVGRR